MAPHQKSTCQENIWQDTNLYFLTSSLLRLIKEVSRLLWRWKLFFWENFDNLLAGRRRWCHFCFCKLSAAPHFYLEFQLSTFLGHSPLSLGHSATECRLDCKMAIFFLPRINFYMALPIPHICHFFYTGRIFEFQSFTPKNYAKHP